MSSATALRAGEAPATPAPFRWAPVLAVALSTFSVVTAEMMPVGLLTPIAGALGVAPGTAGTSLTITGVIAAVVAMFTPPLIGRADRRTVLVAFLALLALGNALSAVATSFAVFAAGRVLIGVAMGVVWSLAGGTGPRLADERHVGRAMTVIFSGVSIAMVAGVPLGTFAADLWGWRAAFHGLAGLSLVAAGAVLITLPRLKVAHRSELRGMLTPLRHPGVATGLVITALVVIGHFAAYTYVRPVLETGPGMTAMLIVAALAVFGAAGVLGNFAIGALAARDPRAALLIALGGIAIAAALLPVAVAGAAAALVVLALWGFTYGSVTVSTQSWIRVADPAQLERSSGLWSGVFNGGIAVGALLGGAVFDRTDGATVLWIAAGIVLAGLAVTLARRPRTDRD
ncbi:MFS transporter [Glycomyces harbinensis]|uniref:Predicted arabinose efflux permease, MFS family n=1 Tax=Glycomyces harbinensis TaxID=58114 RepID=A0A1G6T3B4_9ACTN|nr:MFS transporter [Glycomyces harbinensis]SDD23538.1 Predicted arabinose efflux permease, MFS family [Glycomyces harbinensis]